MREILFRGQIRRKGEKVNMPSGKPLPSRWCYGGIFAPNADEKGFAVIYGAEGERDEPITGAKLEKYPVYRDTVGQYTGLSDKNSKKIFEGDIIAFTVFDYNGGDTQHKGVVKWSDTEKLATRFMIWHNNENEYYGADGAFDFDWVHYQDSELEIIGNIYDNPELLEAQNADA